MVIGTVRTQARFGMKDTIAIVILLLAFAGDASPGQTPAPGTVAANSEAANVLEPEFEGVFFRLVAGSLVPLERQPVPVTRSIIANAIAGAYSVAGGRSPVRFPANVPIEFVVRAPSATADPTNVYRSSAPTPRRARRLVAVPRDRPSRPIFGTSRHRQCPAA